MSLPCSDLIGTRMVYALGTTHGTMALVPCGKAVACVS